MNAIMDVLSLAREKFSLLDRIPLGVCVLQPDYTIIFWNDCLEEWTNIPRQEIVGTVISDRFPHFRQPLYTKRLNQVFQTGLSTIFSSQLHQRIIPVEIQPGAWRVQHSTVTAVPAFNQQGFYALLSIQDVTDLTYRVQEYRNLRDQALAQAEERQRAKEAAETANRIKDEFLAIVSHELRSPLNPILGWSRLLKNGGLNPSTAERAVETIERNAQTQAQLIDDLLDVSRILRGKLALDMAPVNLARVIYAALDTVHLAAEAKSIQFHLEIEPDAGWVRGDANRLQQIVWNLLSNAVKFTPVGGQVMLSLKTTETETQLQVRDTGKGIKPEFLPHIFESFRQADSSITRSVGGLGLGLAIVRQLVELHGGVVWAESLGEGKGATFTICFPYWRNHSRESLLVADDRLNPISLSSLPLSGLQVLVVDDEVDTRELVAFLLTQQGAEVTMAASAKQALTAIAQSPPDLVVSDLGMPEIDGYEFISQLRSIPPDPGGQIPALAFTAYAAETTRQQVFAAGFQGYVAKPVNPDQLVAAIVGVMGDDRGKVLKTEN